MRRTPLGWSDFFEIQRERLEAPVLPARVAFASHGIYKVLLPAASGPPSARRASLAGKLLRDRGDGTSHPGVGDWVGLHPGAAEEALLPIVHVFSRQTSLVRKEAGQRARAQLLAANVDTVVVVSALNAELNVRRLERFVAMARQGGAHPVLVLNKADLGDPAPALHAMRTIEPMPPILVTSAERGDGLDAVGRLVRPGETIVFVGSSGVGKSKLTNRLLGGDRQREGAARESDDRGRHTTSHRELFMLPEGGLLIDTPGLREIALWTEPAADSDVDGESTGFGEIDALAAQCRFRDCRHTGEPGCAVEVGVADGRVARPRIEAWRKLEEERRQLRARVDGSSGGGGEAKRRSRPSGRTGERAKKR